MSTGDALAAPATTPTQEEPARGPDGLEAPDAASARTIAALEGERVEVVGERTATSSTWALPDGSMSTGLAAGPIWVRQGDGDGTASADWTPVNLTLELGEDGTVRPKAHPSDLVLAGEGTPENGLLLSMQRPEGESVGLEWAGPLPEPRLEGPRAVYPAVLSGVDLVVEATRTGYEQYFVITERPASGELPTLELRARATELTATEDADGGVVFSDAAGEVAGTSGTPLAWDAAVDAQRLHPIAEPWTADGELDSVMAPQPDWAPRGEAGDAPAGETVPDLSTADEPIPADAGQVGSPEEDQAGASTGLPLVEAAQVVAPDVVELSLTPDQKFLQDPETVFPVVVDPEFSWTGMFDTFVQHGFASDQSGSAELRIGTYDGGTTVARSFLTMDVAGLAGKQILNADLYLANFHSATCSARSWEVWHTGAASTATRINSQPLWYSRWATPTTTVGYSSACAMQDYTTVDVKPMVQHWASASATVVGVGLKAGNESDSTAWKKFFSAQNGSGVPTLWVQWNTPPGTPAGRSVQPCYRLCTTQPIITNSTRPRFTAAANDADGGTLRYDYEVWAGSSASPTSRVAYGSASAPAGTQSAWVVPAGKLADGATYEYRVRAFDGLHYGPWAGGWIVFQVDTTAPAAPTVASTQYPADGAWHADTGQAGTFTFTLPGSASGVDGIEWGLNQLPEPVRKVTAVNGAYSVQVTPTTPGRQVLQARTVDTAGNRSPEVSYVFYVGRGGLTSPAEGSHVVRRVRLTVEGEPQLTHVKFQWRRGPDSTDQHTVALPLLTTADGQALTDEWTALTDLGGYATWDAGLTLGHVAGPIQVRAAMATDATGAGKYEGPWVTVTVDPDADHAATDTIGPGSVNLLTGDYSLSSTDVDEFGLAIGRTASSRNPRAGLETQAELLNASQQAMSSPLQDVHGGRATVSVATDRYHTGNNSLKIVPTGTSGDSFAYLGAVNTGSIGMAAGRSYRVSGWIHVPSATGLSPEDGRGLRIVAFHTKADGTTHQIASTPKASSTGTWEQLSLDFTVPAGSTNSYIRLYNGFSSTSKVVYFDDLSVRELWAPLGPEWTLGTSNEIAGTAYSHISQPYPNVATVHLSGGGQIWFTGAAGDTVWWPQPGAESLTLAKTGATTWRLTELDGTVSDFERQLDARKFELVRTSPPAASGQTRLLYEKDALGRLRLTRMIAPIEDGVDNWPDNAAACTTAPPAVGCEVLQLIYATSTTATSSAYGDIKDRLVRVQLYASEDGATPSAETVVRYAYDDAGRLREVWDPRITPALKTSYDYDADGRVVELTPPGEFGWRFRYGTGGREVTLGSGDLVDRSSGRLYDVSRASLVPGTSNEVGPDTTSTVVYAVPLTRNAGGPHDLDPATLATWAQHSAPTDATAIFGPEDEPGLTTATAVSPGPDGYRYAVVHYLDSSGREVNTATPAGPDAPPAGYIDTAEYDAYGNVVRELSAGNRLLALGVGTSSAADLASLSLTSADTATRASALSSYSTYGPEGLDLRRSRGPLLRLAVGNDPNNVQLVHDVTTYDYDQAKPDGVAYHLVTTQTDALLIAGSSPEQLVDVTVTRNGYDPIDGQPSIGPTSGWKVGSPTTVTVDAAPGGANQTASIRYDADGRAVESRRPGSDGSDAGSTRAAYYTAGLHPERPGCGNKPAWAGLPCTNWVAGDVTGHDSTRMATTLPVRTVTDYSRYGSVEQVTESATGPLGGATVTQTRTTTTVYDDADRVTSTLLTATGAGTTTAPMPRTVSTYDPDTGHVTVITAEDPTTGADLSTVEKTFDALGRMTRYRDADGGVTDTEFDVYGRPVEVTDSLGTTTTFSYDRQIEPRGYVTSVSDSVAGTISATYGADGELLEQVLPGGVELRIGYDANRTPNNRSYLRASDDSLIASSTVVENAAGEWVSHTTAASTKRYTYDALHHLTQVQDTVAGRCTTRQYAYNDRAGRTALQTALSGTATCVDPSNPGTAAVATVGYSYDSADRLLSDTAAGAGDWVYDPLGRITGAPVRGSPGVIVTNAYYANDLIASQTIDGVARQTWNLDPLGRFGTYINETWAVGGDGNPGWQEAVTKTNHYDSDSDSPAWITEDASLPDEVTRYVDGLDGNLAMQTGKTGGRVLQLIDLHGDVMTTLPIGNDQPVADWNELRHQAADEFGNPTDVINGTPVLSDGSPPNKDNRYGWLGGKQRSADALAGVLLMGVRLYDPATGRFWSPDPVPGGNATAYDYCAGDPVNCSDLDGQWGWFKKLVKKVAKKVAKVAEVVATVVPGPIGAAAAAVSAVAYAATGNRAKALEMTVTVALAAVGAATVVAAAKWGGAAIRAGRSLMSGFKGAKEFKSTAVLGRRAHAVFERRVVKAGGRPGRLESRNRVRGWPDGHRANGAPLELKPHNRRALAAGERQLQRYETMYGMRGELWSYRQTRILKRFKFTRIR